MKAVTTDHGTYFIDDDASDEEIQEIIKQVENAKKNRKKI